MIQQRTNAPPAVYLATALLLIVASPAVCGTVQDFSGPSPGIVAAGTLPGGGSAPGMLFPGFTLSVTNNGGGPSSLLIFNSAIPTGGDTDLGTPNQAFGGNGIGFGGGPGPGQNNRHFGNLLIVAENLFDPDMDGLVNEPDDEAGGGVITFVFDETVSLERVVLVDIDRNETAKIDLYRDAAFLGSVNAQSLGDNSVQTVDTTLYGLITRADVFLSGSGAVAEIEFEAPSTVPTEQATWGSIKSLYQD